MEQDVLRSVEKISIVEQQKQVKMKLSIFSSKILSINSILVGVTSIFNIMTKNKIIIVWQRIRNFAELKIFASDRNPTKKINITIKRKIISSLKKMSVNGVISKRPPINGIFFWLTNNWCFSPEKLGKKLFLYDMKIIIKDINK